MPRFDPSDPTHVQLLRHPKKKEKAKVDQTATERPGNADDSLPIPETSVPQQGKKKRQKIKARLETSVNDQSLESVETTLDSHIQAVSALESTKKKKAKRKIQGNVEDTVEQLKEESAKDDFGPRYYEVSADLKKRFISNQGNFSLGDLFARGNSTIKQNGNVFLFNSSFVFIGTFSLF